MQLYHATDIHLNFLSPKELQRFLDYVVRNVGAGNALVITGDIDEAPTLDVHMESWKKRLTEEGIGFWFICGNHDYYHGSIVDVRNRLSTSELLKSSWLPTAGPIELTNTIFLIGHDGWYDGLYADWFASRVMMNDYKIIRELKAEPTKSLLFDKLQNLSQEGADFIYKTGTKVFLDNPDCDHLVIATHVPPFKEASVHKGKVSDNDWLPHFSSKRMGDAILALAEENPSKGFTVLCGHTHSAGVCKPVKNITCHTGKADYGYPNLGLSFKL